MKSGRKISKNIKENEAYLKKRLGIDESFDLGFREIIVLGKSVQLYYVNGLNNSSLIQQIIKVLVEINDIENRRAKINEVIANRMVHQQFEEVMKMDEAVDQLLSGLIIIFIDGDPHGYVIDVREYPGRSPDEPDTERVVRGSRDGYTENIMENAGLTRRRIRDERLRLEIMNVGERSKTDICIGYLQDVADNDLIELVKDKLSEIDIDGIPMADKTIEEFISKQKWTAYPHVRYTERPDTGAKHLLEGHILLFIDTSPSVIILPTTFFDHLVHAEEHRQSSVVGTVIRWIRFLGVLASLYLLPLWLMFVIDPSLLPPGLSFIGPNEEGNVPIYFQIILADIGVEFLRMAAIHTPTPLATAMGLIAALMIGEIAIDVGLFSAEVILYVAISTIGTYITPSYELSVANKLVKICLILATAFFGAIGFMVSFTLSILYLAQIKALKTPYLWPFIPFNAKAFLNTIVRIPTPYANIRPSIVHPKNKYSQPVNKKR
ncbi:MAG TPA: spore germination protein [Bacillota bacterium]|nr:spore germination protein [Bacillota bacterium]